MHAAILHAQGDESIAAGVAAKIAPAESFAAALRGDAGVTLGDQLALFAIWSQKAEAQGLGQALSRIASRAEGRCVVVRADGTPLPALPPGARLLAVTDAKESFVRASDEALGRIAMPTTPARLGAAFGGWTPGVGIGLAIYAGMFVAAGAWRSEEVSVAIANGKAAPLAGALHSFQVASADAWSGAVQIAQAPSTPTAAFVTPQRVALTAALDTQTIPIVAADVADAVPLAAAPARSADDDIVAPPVRLHAIAPEAIITTAAYAPAMQPIVLDVGANDSF